MAKQKKRWESYADYLKSKQWKQVKENFLENFQGFPNRCEITFLESDDLNFHHFKYPKDWAEDSWENLILVSNSLHNLIHNDQLFKLPEHCMDSRAKAKTCLSYKWIVYKTRQFRATLDSKDQNIENLNDLIFRLKAEGNQND